MEIKKITTEGLEGKSLELALQNNAIVDKLTALESKGVDVSALETRLKAVEGLEQKSYDAEITALKTTLDSLEKKSGAVELKEPTNMRDAIVMEIKKLGVNNVAELQDFITKQGKPLQLEVKAIDPIATTANSDTVGRTNLDMTIAWTPTVKNAFLGKFRVVAEQSNKSKFGYMEGTYTGAGAYVGEGAGNANSDSATASATFGTYAKVQAVLSVNTEVYEDLPDFADGLLEQMRIATEKFVDGEAYTGDGLAPGGVQHIKGLKEYATEAVFTAGGNFEAYAASVESANIADLAGAVKSKIDNLDGQYVADKVYMNPVDFYKMSKLKDSTKQPLFATDMLGRPILGGMVVETSSKITANTMLILDSNVVEWRTKRAMQLKIGQVLANDVLNDKQSAVLMARYQLLVRSADTVAVIKISDIASAVGAISTTVG